ncbi:MAG: hypothetical protein IJ215_00115 [Clostridia bacterium]|nr:hypothetical protein [Clostridia bacterium]
MTNLYDKAIDLKDNSTNDEEFTKYAIISEIVSKENWVLQVKAEDAIQILTDLKFDTPQNVYTEIVVDTLNSFDTIE